VVVVEVGVETPREFASHPEPLVAVGDALPTRRAEIGDQLIGIELGRPIRLLSAFDPQITRLDPGFNFDARGASA
jgi:hypothetical protein